MPGTPFARLAVGRAGRARRRTRRPARRARRARRIPGGGARRGGGRGIRDPAPAADRRDLPFVTIDPPAPRTSTRRSTSSAADGGYLVHYAIADVPGFVRPDGAVDREARGAGRPCTPLTAASPCTRRCSSEDRASLLPNVDRSAFLWTFELDEAGAVVRRTSSGPRCAPASGSATPRRRRASTPGRGDPLELLREVGLARIQQERDRGGASLNVPDEEIVRTADGGYALERRRLLPVEDWNAQLSLMTGMAAAELMLEARVGILRTMPGADRRAHRRLPHADRGAGAPVDRGDRLRRVPARPRSRRPRLPRDHAGGGRAVPRAGYEAMDGEAPADPVQSALAAPYAHVTAPLRRLVDRWGLVVCEALSAGREVPGGRGTRCTSSRR